MFIDIARPLAARGIKVIPVQPLEKRCLLEEWQKKATTDIRQIEAWNKVSPQFNVGCVGTPDTVAILDCDRKGLLKRIEEETGQKFPPTLVVKSGGKGAAHVYFRQNEWSRNLGNRKAPGLFDLQSIDRYVVGPGSTLGDGKEYQLVQDAEIAEFPEWLAVWIDRMSAPQGGPTKGGAPVHEDFDFAEFLDHYEISGHQDGNWFITDACPVAGYKHEQSVKTGFYWDGSSLGFHCFASGCEGSGMSVGQVIRHLNKTHEAYEGVIWQEEEKPDFTGFDINATLGIGFKPAEAMIEPIAEPEPSVAPTPSEEAKPRLVRIAKVEDEAEDTSLVGVRASQIQAKLLRWLWPGKFPEALCLVTGKPDNTKSLMLLDLAARISRGDDWPDGEKNVLGPRIVLYCATEDNKQSTLVPRLMAAGANLDNIIFPLYVAAEEKAGVKEKYERKINLAHDLKILRKAVENRPEIACVILDPMNSYWEGVDENKAKEVAPVLEKIAQFCEESKIAVIGLIHHSKRSDTDALGKVLGSVRVGGIARAVWEVSKDPEDDSIIRMALAKGNLHRNRSGMTYHVEDSMPLTIEGQQTTLPRIVWDAALDKSADDLLAEQRAKAKEPKDRKREMARALLTAMLPCYGRDAFTALEQEGIGERTVKDAKRDLGVLNKKLVTGWWWYLPGQTEAPDDEQVLADVEAM